MTRSTRKSRQADKIRKRLARKKIKNDHNHGNDDQTPGSSKTLQPAERLAFNQFPAPLQHYFNTDGDISFHSNTCENEKSKKGKQKADRAKKYREMYQNDRIYREKKKKSVQDYFQKQKRDSTKHKAIKEKKRQHQKYRYWTDTRYKLMKIRSSILRYASNPVFRNKLRIYSSGKYPNNPWFAAKVRNAMMTKYRTDMTYKEKKKKKSTLKYSTDVPFRESIKRASVDKYKRNGPFRESVKWASVDKYKRNGPFRESVKRTSVDKYKRNGPFRESVKRASVDKYKRNGPFRESVKRASVDKYKRNGPFRESVKRASVDKYKRNGPFRESVKRASVDKYKRNGPFRESVKRTSVDKYKRNGPFRESVKRTSVDKYKSNKPFRDSVRRFSKMKYMRFESFRNNVKASSIKKYSSNPLFRCKIKLFLQQKYHNSTVIRDTKKRKVNLYRKSVVKAIKEFRKSVKDVPVYVCTVCSRMLYKSQVKICKHSVYSKEGTMSDIASECITGKFVHQCTDICKVNCHKTKEWICFTCDRHLRAGNMPPQALANGLTLPEIPPELKKLNNLERQLVALRIPFMKVISLPKGGQKGVKGPCINVPSDLNSVTSSLPRPLNDSQMIKVKLKRKLMYKGHQMYEWIDPKNVQEALQYLIRHNKWYENVTINNMWYDHNDSDLIQNMDIPGNDSDSDLMEYEDSSANNKVHDADNAESLESNQNNSVINQNVDNHITDLIHHMREETTENPSANVIMDTSEVDNESNRVDSNDDIPAYPIETCLQPLDLGQEVLDTNGKIFCVAPAEKQTPKSIFKDEGMDAMSFPHLLPDGDFGFSMERRIKLTPSKYFNARILSADTRFANDVQFIFFAQYVTEITDIRSKISIALRKGKNTTTDGKKINAGMLRTPESLQNMLKSVIGYRFLQPIRGSPPYWERTMKELHSMIRQIGIPTFFVTFSAGETRWNDLIETLVSIGDDDRNPDDLEWLDKCKLIQDNPVMCARLFDHRVKALFRDLLMSPANPIGKVIDFFIRTEFQHRGSPHIHCLVWIENAPRLDVNTDAEVCQFVDKHISCQLPKKNDDEELFDIVSAVQRHSKQHTKSCRKNNTTCRFNFPRPPVQETFIARPVEEETQDNTNNTDHTKPVSIEEFNELCKPQKPAKSIIKDVWTIMSSCENIEDLTMTELFRLANTNYQEFVDCLKSVTTKNVIHHKRDLADSFINNYNKYLLKAWNANMDIQFVTDVYQCVSYILGYINKAEGEMSELLVNAKKEAAEGNNSNKETMKKIGQVYMGNREVSAQEAVYRVCSYKLKDSSRQVVFIPTGSNTLKLSLPISAMKSKESSDENVWATTLIERYYARPDSSYFNDICLADFASAFVIYPASRKPKSSVKLPVYELQNGLGFIKHKKKGKENIIRYPRFNSKKNPEEFHMTLLQLYLPHRQPKFKPDDISYVQYVTTGILSDGQRVKDIVTANRSRFEKDIEQLDQALDDILEGNVHQDAWGMIAPEAEAERLELEAERVRIPDDEGEAIPELDISEENKQNTHKFPHLLELNQTKFPEKYTKELMRKLNEKQKEVFYTIRQWCIDVTLKKEPEPFHIFLTGGAGTGKTHLVKAIYAEATRILSKSVSPPNSTTVVLTAPTGTAAYNVKGATLHTVFSLSKMLSVPYKPLGESTLNSLRQKLEHLKILVIDEISMVDMKLLMYIHGRLCQIKHCKEYFGNVSILAVGDFYQLSPVRAAPLYKEISTVHIDLWKPLFKIVQLTEIMRQKDDVEFALLLNRIRVHLKGQPLSEQDLDLLQSVSSTETPEAVSTALHVFPTNSEVSKHNSKMMKQVCQRTVFAKARDFFKNSVSGQLNERQEPFATRQGENLDDVIELGLDARVMLIRNIDVEDGLVNGAFGTITAIERTPQDNVQAVYVKFDIEETGRATISKQVVSKNAPKRSVRISRYEENLKGKNATRKQFPLRLGFAATIHKVQGLTVKELVVSLRKTFEAGMAYVALSRVTSLDGLHLINFDPGVMYSSADIAVALDAMEQFVGHTSFPVPVSRDNSSIVITLHNTEGLLPHKDDIKVATFVKESDIICFSETWLKPNANISHLLPTFVFFNKPRSESYSSEMEPYKTFSQTERGGVGTFIHQDLDFCQKNIPNTNMECVFSYINCGVKFILVNIYRPQFYPIKLFCTNLKNFLQELDKEDTPVMCVGDFNDNAFGNRPKVIALFSSFKYTQIVTKSTTEAGTCLDLVFVKNFEKVPHCTVVPLYYSFHEAVQIHVPLFPG